MPVILVFLFLFYKPGKFSRIGSHRYNYPAFICMTMNNLIDVNRMFAYDHCWILFLKSYLSACSDVINTMSIHSEVT